MLNPNDISWISPGDPAQQYLGWVFFNQSAWTFPLGLNPNFGLQLGNSIVYSDSIPLMALIFKIFSPSLPFQYFGIWLLACFVLQALLGLKLVELFSKNRWIQVLGASFFLSAPIFLYRLGFHNNLEAHWIILSAIYLNLKPFTHQNIFLQRLMWVVLVIVGELINFYLFAMVLALWFANLLDSWQHQTAFKPKWVLLEIFSMLIVVLLVGWQIGYFVASASISQGEYGISRVNLLSFFDPAGWSFLLPSISKAFSSYESFSYLGLGLISLMGYACLLLILIQIKVKATQRHQLSLIKLDNLLVHRFFLGMMLLLTCFALTNQLELGPITLHYSLPQWILYIGSIARQSSRLIWPLIYFLMLLILAIIIQLNSVRKTIFILTVALSIQIADTSKGWWPITFDLIMQKRPPFDASLADPAWPTFAKHYQEVLRIPAAAFSHQWETFATYAAKHHMATNSVYLARVDSHKLDAMNVGFQKAIATGQYNPNALYIVDDEKVLPVLMHLDSSRDLFARINGINVIAPGWKVCASCPPVAPELEIHQPIPQVELGKTIDFSAKGTGKYFLVGIGAWPTVGWGWSFPEGFGTWSEGDKAKLVLPLPDGAKTLTLQLRALVTATHPEQKVDVWVNGQLQQSLKLTQDSNNAVKIALPTKTPTQDYVTIELKLPNKVKPKDIGIGDDIRELAIGMVSGEVR